MKEALKLALDALEELNSTNSYWWQDVDEKTIAKIDPAITAIKAALAQPQQEPKFWYDEEEGLLHDHFNDLPLGCIPLYTTPPQQEPWCMKMNGCTSKCEDCPVEVVQQEPVAWYVERQHIGFRDHGLKYGPFWKLSEAEELTDPIHILKPLYTSPPQRTEERNFCSRCGKRTSDLTVIHTCTPPQVTALAQEQEPVVIKKSSRRYCSQSEQEIDFGN